MPMLRDFREAIRLHEAAMKLKYGDNWRIKMLVREREYGESLQRALAVKTESVYAAYRPETN